MDLDSLKPNSHISQNPPAANSVPETEKKVTRVVSTPARRRKKPLSAKFKEVFIGGEANSVWEYILFDVVIPAAKDMVTDAITQGVERLVFGDSRPPGRRTSYRPGGYGYTNYNRFSTSRSTRDDPRDRRDPRESNRRRSNQIDDIILSSRQEAEDVIDQMFAILQKYDQVTVSDVLEMVGVTPQFTDEKWGWTELRGLSARRINNGYLLDLPRPEAL
jgi:hypothetical protein